MAEQLPIDFELQKQQLNRQQKMAEALLAQGQQMAQGPAGQMVSGRYVPNSFFQNAQAPLNMLVGAYLANKGDEKSSSLAQALRERQLKSIDDYATASAGTPAVEGGIYGPQGLTTQTTADMYGPNMELNPAYKQVAAQEAKGPDYRKMMAVALDPYAHPVLRSQVEDMLKGKVYKNGDVEYRTNLATGQRELVGQGMADLPSGFEAAQIALNLPQDPSTWTAQQRQAASNYDLTRQKASASNISVNTGNKLGGKFGELVGEGAYNLYTAAQNAPQAIENSKRTIQLVNSGAFTGPTANVALEAAKLWNVAGADNKDTIAKTELLAANRGKALLNSAKASGLAGSQGLTEGERKFLADAEGGRITLNGDTLKAMAGLEIKLQVANQEKWNKQYNQLPAEVRQATGVQPVQVYTGLGGVDTNNALLK